MNDIIIIKNELLQSVSVTRENNAYFFKTGPGDYAEHDKFIGVTVPKIRKIAKTYQYLSLQDIQTLLESPYNEERLAALFILIHQYKKAGNHFKEEIYQFYISHIKHINNWNLVDASAHLIIGTHLFKGNREMLFTLAKSKILWERRIAIISTWYFIRNDELACTFELAKLLLSDPHDLMHKAVGWMLREAGKKDQNQLIAFLNQYASQMPRTMLRYSIEKFPEVQRKMYLSSSLKSAVR